MPLESLKSQCNFISITFSLAFATERLSVLFAKIQKNLSKTFENIHLGWAAGAGTGGQWCGLDDLSPP